MELVMSIFGNKQNIRIDMSDGSLFIMVIVELIDYLMLMLSIIVEQKLNHGIRLIITLFQNSLFMLVKMHSMDLMVKLEQLTLI
jgi:hypothetical protein